MQGSLKRLCMDFYLFFSEIKTLVLYAFAHLFSSYLPIPTVCQPSIVAEDEGFEVS